MIFIPAIVSFFTRYTAGAVGAVIVNSVAQSVQKNNSFSIGLNSFLTRNDELSDTEKLIIDNGRNFSSPDDLSFDKIEIDDILDKIENFSDYSEINDDLPIITESKEIVVPELKRDTLFKIDTSTVNKTIPQLMSESLNAKSSDIDIKVKTLEAVQVQNEVLANIAQQFEMMRRENAKSTSELSSTIALLSAPLLSLSKVATEIHNTQADYNSKDLSVKANQVSETAKMVQTQTHIAEYHRYKNQQEVSTSSGLSATPREAEARNNIEKLEETKNLNETDFFDILNNIDDPLVQMLREYLLKNYKGASNA